VPRISRIHYPVTALGPGRRLGVWVQGCPLACPGCIARDTWDPAGGRQVTVADLTAIWQAAVEDGADGLTVSGGEPLDQAAALAAFLHGADEVRRRADREIDFLVYTGYELAELEATELQALELADAVVTGRYRVAEPSGKIWRGSANQRLTPRTALGERRYRPYLDHAPERAPVQVAVDERHVWFIGVPHRGDLPRLEQALRSRGVTWEGVTWRP
jgi:anaerobic ribonucleoside-triphosphate reductase activating protein